MSTMLYNCMSIPMGYRIGKFDGDLNLEAAYHVGLNGRECDCPAGNKPICKHRKMLPIFKDAEHINDGWFLNWNTRQWAAPPEELKDLLEQSEISEEVTAQLQQDMAATVANAFEGSSTAAEVASSPAPANCPPVEDASGVHRPQPSPKPSWRRF